MQEVYSDLKGSGFQIVSSSNSKIDNIESSIGKIEVIYNSYKKYGEKSDKITRKIIGLDQACPEIEEVSEDFREKFHARVFQKPAGSYGANSGSVETLLHYLGKFQPRDYSETPTPSQPDASISTTDAIGQCDSISAKIDFFRNYVNSISEFTYGKNKAYLNSVMVEETESSGKTIASLGGIVLVLGLIVAIFAHGLGNVIAWVGILMAVIGYPAGLISDQTSKASLKHRFVNFNPTISDVEKIQEMNFIIRSEILIIKNLCKEFRKKTEFFNKFIGDEFKLDDLSQLDSETSDFFTRSNQINSETLELIQFAVDKYCIKDGIYAGKIDMNALSWLFTCHLQLGLASGWNALFLSHIEDQSLFPILQNLTLLTPRFPA